MEQNERQGGAPERRPARRRKKKKMSAGRRALKIIGGVAKVLITLVVMGALTASMFGWIFIQYVKTLDLDVDLHAYTMNQTSVIYYQDRETGEWLELQKLMGVENRTLVTYDQIPEHLIRALVSIEDHRFWDHKGVDWRRTGGAVLNMFFSMRDTFGGSTITQQTLKNVTGEKEGTVKRKITEIFRALRLERNYRKEDILNTYLNLVYFGNRAYGVQAAAETYFGKNVEDLTLAESAMIVGLTNNPSRFNPLGADWQQEAARNRQLDVLNEMKKYGNITDAEYAAARSEKLIFVGTPEYEALHGAQELDENGNPIEYESENSEIFSYFVDAVFNQVRNDLAADRDISLRAAENLLYSAGYKIYATVDISIQELAESVYEDPGNLDNRESSNGEPIQSGITVIDNSTGDVVAIVGGVGEKTASRIDNYALARRPCGSSIKPVAVYAPAIDAGVLTPADIIDDYPVRLNESGSAGYPKNYYRGFRGRVTLRSAILNSINTTSLRTLQKLTTASSFAFMTDNLSFDLDSRDIADAPLSMGGLTYGVTTMEMASAFAAFANNGVYTEPRLYTMVLDADGELDAEGNVVAGSVIYEKTSESWPAMKSTTAYLMNEMLRGVVTAGTGTPANFGGMAIAGKTGTTSNDYDRYFVGYTPYYSAAVWVGYPKTNAVIRGYSTNPAITMWRKIMAPIHEDLERRDFITTSEGTRSVTTCLDCGLQATDTCSSLGRTQTVRVVAGTEPKEECQCHETVEICSYALPQEDGTTQTVYYLAGPWCPPETSHGINVTNVPRDTLFRKGGNTTYLDPATGEPVTIEGVAITADDQDSMLETWLRKGRCPYHTEETWQQQPPDLSRPDHYDEWGNPLNADGTPWQPPENEDKPSDSGMEPPINPENPELPGNTGNPENPELPENPDEPSMPQEPGDGLSGFLDGLFSGDGQNGQ